MLRLCGMIGLPPRVFYRQRVGLDVLVLGAGETLYEEVGGRRGMGLLVVGQKGRFEERNHSVSVGLWKFRRFVLKLMTRRLFVDERRG
jgi:hypothetical protein